MATNTIGSLALGLQIIDVIAKNESAMKFTEIQELTGISKSNLYKYLNTLTQMGLLYRDKKSNQYALGYKFLEYGNAVKQNSDFLKRLTPYLKEISSISNMTTIMSIWVNDTPIISEIFNTNYGLNIGGQIGTKLPLMSSVGKMYAAFANTYEQQQWISEQNPTIEFLEELKKVKENCFAYAFEPLIQHVSSVSFPIFDFNNELVSVVGVVGFTEQVPSDSNNPLIQDIKNICIEMSKIYGYSHT